MTQFNSNGPHHDLLGYPRHAPGMVPSWDVKARYQFSFWMTVGLFVGSVVANVLLVTPARAAVARLLGVRR
jgi:hypothetical protein